MKVFYNQISFKQEQNFVLKLNLPTGGPLYVIVEYCQHGNLRDFLRSHDSRNEGYERPNSERLVISERTLVSFARQVRYIFPNYSISKSYIKQGIKWIIYIMKSNIYMII